MRFEPHRLIFIDETAVTTKMTRLRGLSLGGERLEADAPFDTGVHPDLHRRVAGE